MKVMEIEGHELLKSLDDEETVEQISNKILE